MSTIPASEIVSVQPNVLAAAGNAIDLNAVVLTAGTRVPAGTVPLFPDYASVSAYFGALSIEATIANIYFNGFINSNKKPGALYFTQYPSVAVSAFLRGGNASGLTLANIQALNALLNIVVDGATHAATINLAAATSFSNAASLIQTALNAAVTATGSVAANVVVGRLDPNSVTGSISGTTMTVSAVATGAVLAPGQTITGAGIAPGTTIVSQLTVVGAIGGTGTYQVSISQSVLSTTIIASGGGFTVASVTTGALRVGQTISGTGVTAGTTITALGTGTGAAGTYAVSVSQTVAPVTTVTASGGLLNVTVGPTGSGVLAVGDVIAGTGVTVGNTITALGTGTGGTGTYFVSVGDTAGSTTITVAGAGVVVTYDSVSGGFVITSGITGALSTIAFATGALATSLLLTAATGAVVSQGAAAASPGAFMDALIASTQNWATFMTAFNPDSSGNSVKLAFAAWASASNNRYTYVCWDNDPAPALSSPASSCLGALIAAASYGGTCLIGQDAADASDANLINIAAFVCGYAASLDFTQTNGRATAKFRAAGGLLASATNITASRNLIANGYNFYGAYGTANGGFIFLCPGSVSGRFLWLDSYVNQIWLNAQFKLSLLNLLMQAYSIPYNAAGAAQIETALSDNINAALNFGAFRTGVTLSASQVAAVNGAAGAVVAPSLQANGFYLQIKDASAAVRQARGSPPCNFWYVDGQSIQQISLASIEVQ